MAGKHLHNRRSDDSSGWSLVEEMAAPPPPPHKDDHWWSLAFTNLYGGYPNTYLSSVISLIRRKSNARIRLDRCQYLWVSINIYIDDISFIGTLSRWIAITSDCHAYVVDYCQLPLTSLLRTECVWRCRYREEARARCYYLKPEWLTSRENKDEYKLYAPEN